MQQRYELNDGFMQHYLISGPKVESFQRDIDENNQLFYESRLRNQVDDASPIQPPNMEELEEESSIGMPWNYHYSSQNPFVDLGSFYSKTVKTTILALTKLGATKKGDYTGVFWTYGAFRLWIDNRLILENNEPAYYHMMRHSFTVSLDAEEHEVFIELVNLGVRDTRNLFALQWMDSPLSLYGLSPSPNRWEVVQSLHRFLDGIKIGQGRLKFPYEAPKGTTLIYDSRTPDLTKASERFTTVSLEGESEVVIDSEYTYVTVCMKKNKERLERRMMIPEHSRPYYRQLAEGQTLYNGIYSEIEKVIKLDRGEGIGFSIFSILARKALGQTREDDIENIYETLDYIEQRIDCADFILAGLLRYLWLYPKSMDKALTDRVKEVLTGFRYWMDEDGMDCMCFWSENHSLLFYSCAYIAGRLYPDEQFTRAHRTGKVLATEAKVKLHEWLDDVLEFGFEEFLSGSYMSVTFAALLNVIDFTEEEVSQKARRVTDHFFKVLAYHTFDGVLIAPQGRVYADVLFPYTQSIQSLINLVDNTAPASFAEGWLAFYEGSTYDIPTDYRHYMHQNLVLKHNEGNAEIMIHKKNGFMLTSAQSEKNQSRRWLSTLHDETMDIQQHSYIKSLNEVFHGTTHFQPGKEGYQQHLWTAALSMDTLVFTNHPGAFQSASSMRPGYWFGNGIIPAIKQDAIEPILGAVYVIPMDHPVNFTHVYWPQDTFDRMIQRNGWLIGQKNNGYVGLWASGDLEPYDDDMARVEYRVNSRCSAYFCVCKTIEEFSSLEEFETYCYEQNPQFNPFTKTLTASSDYTVVWEKDDRITKEAL